MCYSGKCIYEDYMGDCRAPNKLKSPCKRGYKIGKFEFIVFKMKCNIKLIIHIFRYKFSKKYKKEIDDLPF